MSETSKTTAKVPGQLGPFAPACRASLQLLTHPHDAALLVAQVVDLVIDKQLHLPHDLQNGFDCAGVGDVVQAGACMARSRHVLRCLNPGPRSWPSVDKRASDPR